MQQQGINHTSNQRENQILLAKKQHQKKGNENYSFYDINLSRSKRSLRGRNVAVKYLLGKENKNKQESSDLVPFLLFLGREYLKLYKILEQTNVFKLIW